jgi:hypothetical protein
VLGEEWKRKMMKMVMVKDQGIQFWFDSIQISKLADMCRRLLHITSLAFFIFLGV